MHPTQASSTFLIKMFITFLERTEPAQSPGEARLHEEHEERADEHVRVVQAVRELRGVP